MDTTNSAAALTVDQLMRTQFQARLARLARDTRAVLGVQSIDLTDGTALGVNADVIFPQYSAIKIPVLLELFRQADALPALLRETLQVGPENRTGGSGVLDAFADGASALALEDLATLMIALSDNTATNMLIDRLGMPAVNGLLTQLGCEHTRLRRKMIRLDFSARNEENTSTPGEGARIMAQLARGELPLSALAQQRARAILEVDKADPLRDPIPAEVRVAFKPGGGPGARTAWAWVDLPGRPYVLAVMATFTANDAEGEALVREVSAAAYDHFSRLRKANRYGVRT